MIRSSAACISSRRELWPTSSNVSLSRDPWKRSIRTRSSSSSSLVDDRAAVAERAEVLATGRTRTSRSCRARRRGGRRRAIAPAACAASSSTGTPSASISRDRRDVAEQVHDDDRLRARRQRGAHRLRRDTERLGIDVAEHRPRAGRRDRLGRRVERERRHDDLVARPDAQRAQRQRQRVRAVGHADRVARAEVVGELRLEARDLRAEDVAARVEHLGDFACRRSRSGASGVEVSKRGTAIAGERAIGRYCGR